MDFLNGKIQPIYLKYLLAAFGSAMITSVYSIVDTAMVGQYHGPEGTAALAVVAPVRNIIYSLGLLMGIGGSVIFSAKRGRNERKDGVENQYFTASVIGSVLLAVLAWLGILCFERQVLTFFGADASLLKLASEIGKTQEDSVFVFDEPSIGLHPLDVQVLLGVFQALLDHGATVIVIEHDLDVIRNADYVIDMGPGGGEAGGRIVASGTPQEIKHNKNSITGRYL